jgi:hypothetical protein
MTGSFRFGGIRGTSRFPFYIESFQEVPNESRTAEVPDHQRPELALTLPEHGQKPKPCCVRSRVHLDWVWTPSSSATAAIDRASHDPRNGPSLADEILEYPGCV